MIRIPAIQEALAHLVGWEQHYDPAHTIEDELTESESGLTFQGAHPLVTLENVRAMMPEGWALQYPVYAAGANYYEGDKVRHDGKVWKATNFSTGQTPGSAGAPWIEFHPLSDYVAKITLDGITTAVQTFIQQKQLTHETRTLLERRTFFDGAARLEAIIDPRGKWCGFEIVPVRAMGVTTKIERIGLQMRGATGTVRVYLFHSSQSIPATWVDCYYTNTSGGFQWFVPKIPIYLPYIWPRDWFEAQAGEAPDTAIGNDAGGAWYLCYNQNELPEGMRALNVARDWSAEP